MSCVARRSFLTACLLIGVGVALTQAGRPAPTQAGAKADLVIKNGSLLAMVSDRPDIVALKGIVINGGKIERIISASDKDPLPSAGETIDARSSFVLPGLIDPHVHFRPWFPEIFLEYGVTTLMDTGPCGARCEGDPNEWIMRFRQALNSGERRGSTLFTTGMKMGAAGAEGTPENHTYYLKSMDELVQKIELLASLHVDGLKAEASLPVAFRKRIVEEGARRGLPVVGHSREARESLEVGMLFIEHMYPIAVSLSDDPKAKVRGNEYLMDLTKAPALIDLMVAKHAVLNPTLLGGFDSASKHFQQYAEEDARLLKQPLFQAVPEAERARILKSYGAADSATPEEKAHLKESYQKVQTFLQQLHAKGGRIIVGSDATNGSMPGLATHREMQLMVEVGLPPYTVLLGATRYAADLLQKRESIGTVAVGKQADLLIVAADPVKAIANTQQVRYVVKKGKVERRPPTN